MLPGHVTGHKIRFSNNYNVMEIYSKLLYILLLMQLITRLAFAGPCRLSEFTCENGKCIGLGRYCDSTDDCGDGSDENVGCTPCNRTIYGEVNIKYPLRITEPFQRYLPFVCRINFIAGGRDYGDIIELTFLSFQIGSLELDRNHTAVCEKGFMKIMESPRSTIRGLHVQDYTKILTSSDRYFQRGTGKPVVGQLCGEMAGVGATYYSEGNNVTLLVVVPSRAAMHFDSFSLYLTYRFLSRLPSRVPDGSLKHSPHLGIRVPGSFCDREFINCHRRKCVLRSPNFPGFYPRNITCRYGIRQEFVPDGCQAQIILVQPNEYKISIYVGSSNTGSLPRTSLTSNCFGDLVDVYDGSSSEPLLEFCGAGSLPEVITSGPEAAVMLKSAPYQVLYDSRLELQIKVRFVNSSEFRVRSGKCSFRIDGYKQRRGVLYTPHHTVPNNITCTYTLTGRSKRDRIWLYFLNYYVRDDRRLDEDSKSETCLNGRLDIYGFSGNSTLTFCEKSHPKMCARAADYSGHVPLRPCSYPEESYLSTSSVVTIKHHVTGRQELSAVASTFTARYEFIEGDMSTGCDRHFSSSGEHAGNLSSPRNLFLYGRGGRTNLTCTYTFSATRNQRVRIEINSLRLPSEICSHYYDKAFQRHKCNVMGSGQHSEIKVTERRTIPSWTVGCLCDVTHGLNEVAILESSGPEVTMTFIIVGMSSFEDFNNYWFEANYTFFIPTACEGVRKKQETSQGRLDFTVSPNQEIRGYPIRCHWILEASPRRYLYLKVRGYDGSEKCPGENRLLVYAGPTNQPVASVCSRGETELNIFSSSWYNDTYGHHRIDYTDRVVLEAVAHVPGYFRLRWIEVTKLYLRTQSGQTMRNVDCLHACPELSACIAPELWCDGHEHCPSGHDESSEHCRRFPILYVAAGGALALLACLAMVAFGIRRCRKNRKTNKIRRPLRKDVYEMESPIGATISVY
ncbi:uncharacterized protein [Centruroides vittatus]|uniref:uncharacterized protein n=1 Tax=Centruroides vittatus TaxID=120091 RepID=UPI003510C02B